MSLGENIKRLRKRRKLQQKDLAEKLGVAQSSVCDWENGTFPRRKRLDQLAEFFGVSVGKLLA